MYGLMLYMPPSLRDIPPVLVVDLDDSLIKGDLLIEMSYALILQRPWLAPVLILKAIQGPLALKQYLAEQISPRPEDLLFRESIVEQIRSFRSKGVKTILASASPEAWVRRIAEYLQCFDHHVGTTSQNLKGKSKLQWIRGHTQESFTYVGDSKADHVIWEKAHSAIVVNPSSSTRKFLRVLEKARPGFQVQEVIDKKPLWRVLFKAMRPHQWAKNALLVLPLLAAHQALTLQVLIQVILGLFSFSAVASCVYLFNDLSDRSSDRAHPSKRKRPIASGDLTIPFALISVVVLLLSGLGVAVQISAGFLWCILVYLTLNLAYTYWLKRTPLLDVVVLSGMYTLRMIAGGQATVTPISQWLLIFSTFFFTGLALVKRYTEVSTLVQKTDKVNEFGRGYMAQDALMLMALGVACSLMAVLVVALYLNSPQGAALYSHPERLWSLVPLLIYWSGRIWLLAGRKRVQDDPVSFALKDRVSWLVGLIALGILKYAV
jgi:4-hydroxybenzoate polyprenyltransferase/phosphoserine phosphatase